MNLMNILKKTYGKILGFLDTEFNIPIDKQKKTVNSFREPKDDIERSFYQYKAATSFNRNKINLLINLVSPLFSIYYLIKLTINYSFLLNKKNMKYDAVFLSDGIIIETIPNSIRKEFPNIVLRSYTDNLCLSYKDIVYLMQIFKRYPISFYFHFKTILKVGMYSGQLIKYQPSAIISYTEGSFTSSIATNYCENHDIEHINIMHGERFFSSHLAFCRFSRYYVWDEYYIKLFKSLRSPVSQFIIEIPEILNRDLARKENYNNYLTYYLADEDKKTLLSIKEIFDKFRKQEKKCAIRIHPRSSNVNLVKQIFKDYYIEDPQIVTIKKSLQDTENVVSLRSTVLFEGYCNGKNIVIDDVTQPHKYQILKELDYIMLEKPHELFSELTKEIT